VSAHGGENSHRSTEQSRFKRRQDPHVEKPPTPVVAEASAKQHEEGRHTDQRQQEENDTICVERKGGNQGDYGAVYGLISHTGVSKMCEDTHNVNSRQPPLSYCFVLCTFMLRKNTYSTKVVGYTTRTYFNYGMI
jgi:hypothetical protein